MNNRGAGTQGRRGAVLAVAASCLAASSALAQQLSGAGLAYNVQHRVLFQGSVHERTGFWFGGEGAVRLGRLRFGVAGLLGKLSGDSSAANPDADVRATSVTLHVAAAPSVLLGMELEARRFASDVGTTTWRLIGGNARAGAGLGLPGLEGTIDVSYFASASVLGGEARISPAFRGTVGASYQSPRGPIIVQLGYRFERFDFERSGSGPVRKEQFRGVLAGIGLRLGRR